MKKVAPPKLIKAGKEVSCQVCGSRDFISRSALLNTRGLSFLNLDWANKKAQLYICQTCGHILWFLED